MGGAIARGLSTCDLFRPQDITVINRRASKTAEIQGFNPELQDRKSTRLNSSHNA